MGMTNGAGSAEYIRNVLAASGAFAVKWQPQNGKAFMESCVYLSYHAAGFISEVAGLTAVPLLAATRSVPEEQAESIGKLTKETVC
jgi:hypothetical protein